MSARVPFTFFLLVMGVNSMFAIFFMWEVVRQSGTDIFVYFGILLFCVFFVSGVIQTVLLVSLAVVVKQGVKLSIQKFCFHRNG